jgi:hypothetical protein
MAALRAREAGEEGASLGTEKGAGEMTAKKDEPSRVVIEGLDTAIQDGLLQIFQELARVSDANVEKRIEREPFEFRELMSKHWKRTEKR